MHDSNGTPGANSSNKSNSGRLPGAKVDAFSDHLPPQNLDAERAVLSALLLDNSAFGEIDGILGPGDFYRDAHEELFRTMLAMHRRGAPVDAVTLAEELTVAGRFAPLGGDDFLLSIANAAPHARNCRYHAQIVAQKSAARRMGQGATEVIRDVYSNLYTSEEILERAAGRLAEIPAVLGEDDRWPDLALDDSPPAPPFPVDVFPPPLRAVCTGIAEITQSPPDFAGAAMLVTASAAIGQSCQVRLKPDWREGPLLYLIVVADPGRAKSPAIRLAVRPLTRIDIDLRKRSERDKLDWEDTKRALKKGEPTPPEPPQRRAIVKDITRESLVTILRDNPRGVLASSDEASAWVGSFNEYKAKGTDRQFWLDIWASQAISVDREGGRRTAWVSNPMCSVLGGMTPEMRGCLSEEQGRDDGFMDRILFVFPDTFPDQSWTEDEIDDESARTWDGVVRSLHERPLYRDPEDDVEKPYLVDFEPRAKVAWVEWFNSHVKELEAPDCPRWQHGVWAKYKAYCARFALILSRLRLAIVPEGADTSRPIALEDVRGAVRLIDYFKAHAARARRAASGQTTSPEANAVLAWIARKGVHQFRERDVRQDLRRRFPSREDAQDALAVLVKAGAIRPKFELIDPAKRGPKPTQLYEINPALNPAQNQALLRSQQKD